MKNRISREKLKEMVNSEDEIENMKKYIESDLSNDEFVMLMEVIRESRLDGLFNDLNIDPDKLEKAKKQIINLDPESSEWPLFSTLYRDHKGEYSFEELAFEYHDSILREGMIIGIDYGKKFIIEDLQNKRFSKEDIQKMGKNEIFEYCDENREEI